MSIRKLNRLFQPKSVAVIGASPKEDSIGKIVLKNLTEVGFQGTVYAVNPKYTEIDGTPCFRTIREVRDPIDLAVVCTPAATVPRIVDE